MFHPSEHDTSTSLARQLVQNVPRGSNLFRASRELLHATRYPSIHPSTYQILIAFAVVHTCIMGVCGMVIVVPIAFSKVKRGKYMWIFKKVYAGKGQTPLYIPNSALAVAFTQLISSMLCLVYSGLYYLSFTSPKVANRVYLYAWVQLMWLFGFYGYWITGWSGLCTILCSPVTQIPRPLRKLVNRPNAVNAFHTLVPIFVSVCTLAWVVLLVFAYHRESEGYNHLDALLNVAAIQLDNQESLDVKTLFKVAIQFMTSDSQLIRIVRWNSYFWAMLGFLTLFPFILSGWSMIGLLRNSSSSVRQMMQAAEGLKMPDSEGLFYTEKITKELRRGYVYVACHFSAMLLSMVYSIVICVLLGVKADKVVLESRWRSLGSWLYLVCGVIVAGAMLLQSWRIFTDLDVIITETSSAPGESDTMAASQTSSSVHRPDSIGSLDDLTLQDCTMKDPMGSVQVVQIQQARVAVRPPRAQAITIRTAF
ncbi:uncharacterized protein MELLADRAFT_71677 [Melampsora larici-populina 98AG31]|uniref:Uncharacterized protein n=1 Tax=Melampsora larici-populina (strain 98AG31 / pathotype 3-4-7) TaxID=747676 RepID=F4RJD4_MELLP|nr:uncharacterized protein MELLADRAFT_71677 [Melampsora larici-populina 98AG31]EGG07294.1 hypothetical protein MELLADRAFT_71677 [Melampsora larici-populina 98AG31]